MRFAPELAGPGRPVETTPTRRRGSVRRTTTIDVVRPDGPVGAAVVDARARDLATGHDGSTTVRRSARLAAALDAARNLTWIEAVPDAGLPKGIDLGMLLGERVAGGFRRHVADAAGADARAGGVWHLLLDDLVGAVLVSGIAQQHEEVIEGGGPLHEGVYGNVDLVFATQADICAGWATDASMLGEVSRTGVLPVSVGPLAPHLDGGDGLGWHETEPLAPHSVRRRRRLDVGPADPDGAVPVEGHFRDSHVDGNGVERCVHEYTVAGRVDTAAGVLVEIGAEARVLPWRECPAAVGSAARVVGVPLGELRDLVRTEFRGTSTCTHLNDVLRSLADLPALL